ncbi:MAG: hypothetical protein VXY63_02845 [Pseudomonadota bacterium]|nr:hypothetical protein [Pseudomonadota bacterium]
MKLLSSQLLVCLLLTNFWSAVVHAEISEKDTVKTLESFFSALSVENYGNGDLENIVTDDFVIFEMGQRFTLLQFKEFLASANYRDWVSTRWVLSNHTVTSGQESAHIFYQNDGVFIFPSASDPEKLSKQQNMWLESALVVKEGEMLKLKFLQSENVTRVDTNLDDVD